MEYEFKLLDLPAQPVLVIRSVLPVEKLPEFFDMAFGGIIAYLNELGQAPAGMPFGAYYNLDMSALDVEAGFQVAHKLPDKGDIKCLEIPAGKFVSTIHHGAYDTVEPAYNALTEWAKVNHYDPSGVAYEYYLNDPSANPSIVAETEIRFPVSM
jgi:effector-binding domain-containing protein